MRLIDADALEEKLKKHIQTADDKKGGYRAGVAAARIFVAMAPTVDAVPVVRCKDCDQWDEEGSYMGRGWCGYQMKSTGPRYFCADGEKGEEEDDHG